MFAQLQTLVSSPIERVKLIVVCEDTYHGIEDDIALYMYGYTATDLNGDGNTDLLDVIYLDYGIANYVFSYHP